MAFILIGYVARELSPKRPVMFLAELARCPRATAKSWYTDHRRPRRLGILKLLRDLVYARGWTQLGRDLDLHIREREDQPKHLSGFCSIDPLTRRDKRNRAGRPKRRMANTGGA
jgi:hypothetical protein